MTRGSALRTAPDRKIDVYFFAITTAAACPLLLVFAELSSLPRTSASSLFPGAPLERPETRQFPARKTPWPAPKHGHCGVNRGNLPRAVSPTRCTVHFRPETGRTGKIVHLAAGNRGGAANWAASCTEKFRFSAVLRHVQGVSVLFPKQGLEVGPTRGFFGTNIRFDRRNR